MDMNTSEVFDVVIIGAGAAGLAAGRTLIDAGVNALILEARVRVGGRAWTVMHGACPLDLGCGWLHSADVNPWLPIAEDLGFTIDRTRSPWGRQYADLHFSAAEQAEFRAASEAFYARLEVGRTQ